MTGEEFRNLKVGDILIRLENIFDYTKDKEYTVVSVGGKLGTYSDKMGFNHLTYPGESYTRFKIKTPESTNKWWESCQKGDLVRCLEVAIPNPDRNSTMGGAGFTCNKIFRANHTNKHNDYGEYAVIFPDNGGFGVYSNNCFPIYIQLPTKGKLPIDELGNWKFIEEHLRNLGCNGINLLSNPKYLVWNTEDNRFSYWKNDGESVQTYEIHELVVNKLQQNNSTNYNLKLKSNGSREISENKVFKINRLVPTITTGLRPTGNVSRGRVRKTTITIRHLSNKASSC